MHSFDLTSSSFESHREVVTFKSRVQLLRACVIVTKKHGKNKQEPKKISLWNNGSLREQNYLIMLSDLSYVNWQNFYLKKQSFFKIARRSCHPSPRRRKVTCISWLPRILDPRTGGACGESDVHAVLTSRGTPGLSRGPCVQLVACLWAGCSGIQPHTTLISYLYNWLCNGRL